MNISDKSPRNVIVIAGDMLIAKDLNVQKLSIYSVNGTELLSSSQNQLKISALSQGNYIARIQTNEGRVFSGKFLKE